MSEMKWVESYPNNQFRAIEKWYRPNSRCKTLIPSNMLVDPYELYSGFDAHLDDIFVVSFPKSGSSWLQEIVWLIKNDVDVQKAQSTTSDVRIPLMEYPQKLKAKVFDTLESPRIFKTHVNYCLLPKKVFSNKCKVLYIARNPKDVCVSYYNFVKMSTHFDYGGDFETFVDLFLSERLPYCPFWMNVKEYWDQSKVDKNVLFVKYEELHSDFRSTCSKIAQFLDTTLTEDQMEKIQRHCTFDAMKANPATNYEHWNDIGARKPDGSEYMRKGQVGDWKNAFTEEMNSKFNEWILKNGKDCDVNFNYEFE